MKKVSKQRSVLMRMCIGVLIGSAAFFLLSWVLASLTVQETIPPDMTLTLFPVTALLAGFLGGLLMRGGEGRLLRGLILGVILALILLVLKCAVSEELTFNTTAWAAMALCVCGSLLGSCILHKNHQRKSKRNKMNTRRK